MRSAAPAACVVSPQTSDSSPRRAGRKERVDHELAEAAGGDLAAQHRGRAVPQHADDARDDEQNDEAGEAGAGAHAIARGGERALDGRREARATASSCPKACMVRTAERFSAA